MDFLGLLYGVLQGTRRTLCEVSDLTPKFQPPSIFRTEISGLKLKVGSVLSTPLFATSLLRIDETAGNVSTESHFSVNNPKQCVAASSHRSVPEARLLLLGLRIVR